MQLVPVPKRFLMTSSYLELRPNSLRRPFRLSAIRTLNPGLAPWAVLVDPFGVLGFATETRLDFPKKTRLGRHFYFTL
ncbi:MAG: hypothetical protein DMG09_21970 [Acidobacteria bacterium]|nr:MAG: hypothetical protein DMG09_21970 [Acidobacteriota bacterium]